METATKPVTSPKEDGSNPTYPLVEGNPDALVLHCSDPRFQEAFRMFLKEELKVRMPAVIAIPGSTASFGVQTLLPKGWYALRKQIELLTEHNDFPRVILINHDNCKGYENISRWLGRIISLGEEQRKHLKSLAEYLRREYLPNSQLELYQARIVDNGGGKVVKFDRIF